MFGEVLVDSEQKTSYRLRRLFVHSLDDRTAARHQRAKDLAKAHRALWTIKHRLGRPAYRDRRLVERKVVEAVAKVANYLRVTAVESAHGLDLGWTLDRNQLRVDGDFDGIFGLLTNESEAAADPPAQLRADKDRSTVERHFRAVKQRPRVGDAVVETLAPATLSPIQAQILERLGLTRPDVYLHPSITPTPLEGGGM